MVRRRTSGAGDVCFSCGALLVVLVDRWSYWALGLSPLQPLISREFLPERAGHESAINEAQKGKLDNTTRQGRSSRQKSFLVRSFPFPWRCARDYISSDSFLTGHRAFLIRSRPPDAFMDLLVGQPYRLYKPKVPSPRVLVQWWHWWATDGRSRPSP